MLVIAAFVAFVVELGLLVALGYGVLRFSTRFLQMRRDIEELKLEVRELKRQG